MILHQVDNSIGQFNYNAYIYRDCIWESHFHANYELIHVLEGSAQIAVNGEMHTLSAGEMILLAPYNIHALVIPADARVWVAVFSPDYVEDFAARYGDVRFSQFRCDQEALPFLKAHLFHPGMPEKYTAIACLNFVCSQCLKHAKAHDMKLNNAFMQRIIQYISSRIGEDITLKKTAEALGYEYHYFSALFHQSFSINFKSFVHLFRFAQASRLLADPTTDVTIVCRECGFGSIRNFNRVFKKMSGCTPTEYQKKLKNHAQKRKSP